MNEISLSIIIPTFNREALVSETIESCLDQSRDDIEVIVVDDGSTDDTLQTIQKFVGQERVQYLYQENQGRSKARNNGLSQARGEFVMFLDSDDVLLEGALSTLLDTAEAHPESGLIAGLRQNASDTLEERYPIEPELLEREYYDQDMSFRSGRYAFFVPSCFIVKRELALSLGGFDHTVDMSEDLDFCLKAAEVTKFTAVPSPVVLLRRHDGNTPGFQHRVVSLRVKKRHLERLLSYRKQHGSQLNRITAVWYFKIASDHYQIGQYGPALANYLNTLLYFPWFAFGGTKPNLTRQLFATCAGGVLKMFRSAPQDVK